MTNGRTSRGVIIPAAGRGTRFGGAIPKQFVELSGVPLLIRTIRSALALHDLVAVVVAIHPDDEAYVAETFSRFGLSDVRLHTVMGSSERQHSVAAALAHPALATAGVILVHDAVRPLTSYELWEKMAQGAQERPAVIPVVPIADTVKQVDAFGQVCGTVDRSALFRVQTPQAFDAAVLRAAYASSQSSPLVATDCASLVERMGYPVFTVPGEETNFKVTTSYDLDVAEFILQRTTSTL